MRTELEEVSLAKAADARLDGFLRALEPTRPDPFRKRRVYVQLTRATVRKPRLARVFLAAAGLLAAASAMAGLAGSHDMQRIIPAMVRGAVESAERPEDAERRGSPSEASASKEPSPAPVDDSVITSSSPSSSRAAIPPTVTSDRVVKSAMPPGEDPTLIRAAIDALRRRHDPREARRALDRYLRQHPNGLFAEEARALSIEAAVAMGDPRAKQIAGAYLRAHPRGKHADLAERVRGQSLPDAKHP